MKDLCSQGKIFTFICKIMILLFTTCKLHTNEFELLASNRLETSVPANNIVTSRLGHKF